MGNSSTAETKLSPAEHNADVVAVRDAPPTFKKVVAYIFFVIKAHPEEADAERRFYGIKGTSEGMADELLYLVMKNKTLDSIENVDIKRLQEMILDEIQSSSLFADAFGPGKLTVLSREDETCMFRIYLPVLHTGALYTLGMKFLHGVATTESRRLTFTTKNYTIAAPVGLVELKEQYIRPTVASLIMPAPPDNLTSLSRRPFRVDPATAIALQGWWRASTESVKDKIVSLAQGSAAGLAGRYASSGGVGAAVEGALGLVSSSRKTVASYALALRGAYGDVKKVWGDTSGTDQEQADRLLKAVASGLTSTQKISEVVNTSLENAVLSALQKTNR